MADQWYYTQDDERQGPVTPEALKEMANSGQLTPDDLIWKKGMKDWIEAGTATGLIPSELADVPPPLPESISPVHAAPAPHEQSAAIPDKARASAIKSGTGAQVLDGLKAAKDIVAQKAAGMKLNHRLSGMKRAIGKAAHDHGIDCGECSGKTAAALADVQKAKQRIEQASTAMKQSAGVKEKAVAAKDFATAKAAQKTADMRMNAAYDALASYVLANGIAVPGMENEIATAQSVQQKVQATNQQIGQLGSGLMKNKIGLAAVAGVALVVLLIGWSVVGRMFGEKEESWQLSRKECAAIATQCVTLADTYPVEAVRLLDDKVRIREHRERILEVVGKLSQSDQDKFAKVWKLWEAEKAANREKGERGWAEEANDPEFIRMAEEHRQRSEQARPTSGQRGQRYTGNKKMNLTASDVSSAVSEIKAKGMTPDERRLFDDARASGMSEEKCYQAMGEGLAFRKKTVGAALQKSPDQRTPKDNAALIFEEMRRQKAGEPPLSEGQQ